MNASDKRLQRQQLRALVRLHPEADSAPVVNRLAKRLKQLDSARIVAAYMALPGEVDLGELFNWVTRDWVFPKVVGDGLNFYRVGNIAQDLQCGTFGIFEPKDGLERVAATQIDLFLCPGLGFDRDGGRMGRGKGFYDRVLSDARSDARKIGVGFPHQIVDRIITDPWDIRMDEVVF